MSKRKSYITKRAVNQRAKTITFNAQQMNEIRMLLERELEDFESSGTEGEREYLTGIQQLRDMFLPGIWIELYRAVEDDDGDFDVCKDHAFSKKEIYEFIEEMLEEARQMGVVPKIKKKNIKKLARKFKWEEDPEFLEFDSSRSHGCGYWQLRIIGPTELEEAIEETREPE